MLVSSLFRQEVLDAKRNSWLGSISLAQPLSLWVLTGFAVASALAIILFLVFGSYTRRERVTGQLVPSRGLATVVAPTTAVVTQLNIEEGGQVRAGQPLAVVTIPSATHANGDTAAALEQGVADKQRSLSDAQAAQEALLQTQAAGLRQQIATARSELDHLQAEVSTQQQQISVGRDALERVRRAEADKLVSTLQLKQQEGAVLLQVSQLQMLQRQAIEQKRGLQQLQQQLTSIPSQRSSAHANYVRDKAVLTQEGVEIAARGALQINAPVTGLVATQLVMQGQAVQAGQPMLSVLPIDSPLQAELLVPNNAVGFIAAGDHVLLRYQAFPYQKFGHYKGTVVRVSRSALVTNDLGSQKNQNNGATSLYRVLVDLQEQSVIAYGKSELLRAGMVLEADVLGEKCSLIEWIFEPLYSLRGKV